MPTNKTRAKYIKQLMEEREQLQESMSKITEETLLNLLGDAASNKVRQILSEGSEDTFDVEEVGTEDVEGETDDKKPEKKDGGEDKKADEEEVDVVDIDVPADADSAAPIEGEESATAGDEIDWADIDKLADENGEIDLTGCTPETCAKVLKVCDPSKDMVRVIKRDDGVIELKDEENGTDYVIDLEGKLTTDDECSCGKDSCPICNPGDEAVYDIDIDVDESAKRCNEETNLGYTDEYQAKDAMTTDSNDEVANPKSTYSMDGGVPKGTKRPYAGTTKPKDVGEPFEIEVVTEEEEVDEAVSTQEDGAYNRGTGMIHGNTNDKAAIGRNASIGGKKVHGTSDNSYSPERQMEAIKRKANEIFMENRQLAALLPKMKKQLEEAIVINQSLSNIVRLVENNATTQDEKADMIRRFNEVRTREESNKLYQQISEELKRKATIVTPAMPADVLAESKVNSVSKPLYESEDITNVLQFMQRLNKIK